MDTNQPQGIASDEDLELMDEMTRIETAGSTGQEPEESEASKEPVPSSQEGSEEQEPAEKPKPEESVEAEAEADEDEDELPEDASERTRQQWEKMKERNRANAAKARKYDELQQQPPTQRKQPAQPTTSVFDDFHHVVPEQLPQGQQYIADAGNYNNLDQTQVNDVMSQMVEQDADGNPVIDIEKVQNALLAADRKAANAASMAQQAINKVNKQNETAQLQEAYTKYPQLNPASDKFDPQFNELIRDRLVRHYVNDQDVPLVQVADIIAQGYKGIEAPAATPSQPSVAKAREDAVQEYKAAQDAKRRQAPVTRGKGAERAEVAARRKGLRAKASTGDLDALAELL